MRTSKAAASPAFVEFHASMSLDNPYVSAADLELARLPLGEAATSTATPPLSSIDAEKHATLASVLKQRLEVWTRVNEVGRP